MDEGLDPEVRRKLNQIEKGEYEISPEKSELALEHAQNSLNNQLSWMHNYYTEVFDVVKISILLVSAVIALISLDNQLISSSVPREYLLISIGFFVLAIVVGLISQIFITPIYGMSGDGILKIYNEDMKISKQTLPVIYGIWTDELNRNNSRYKFIIFISYFSISCGLGVIAGYMAISLLT